MSPKARRRLFLLRFSSPCVASKSKSKSVGSSSSGGGGLRPMDIDRGTFFPCPSPPFLCCAATFCVMCYWYAPAPTTLPCMESPHPILLPHTLYHQPTTDGPSCLRVIRGTPRGGSLAQPPPLLGAFGGRRGGGAGLGRGLGLGASRLLWP